MPSLIDSLLAAVVKGTTKIIESLLVLPISPDVLAVSFLSTTAASILEGALSGIKAEISIAMIEQIGRVQFRAGIEQLEDALATHEASTPLSTYARRRLHDAIVSLDSASAALTDVRTKAPVLLFRGLAKFALGEVERAIVDLSSFKEVASADLSDAEKKLAKARHVFATMDPAVEHWTLPSKGGGPSFAGASKSEMFAERAQARVDYLNKKAQITELIEVTAVLQRLIALCIIMSSDHATL